MSVELMHWVQDTELLIPVMQDDVDSTPINHEYQCGRISEQNSKRGDLNEAVPYLASTVSSLQGGRQRRAERIKNVDETIINIIIP